MFFFFWMDSVSGETDDLEGELRFAKTYSSKKGSPIAKVIWPEQ